MRHASLMHGLIPAVVQFVTAAALLYALGWRKRLIAVGVAAGAVTVAVAHGTYETLGIASEPAPWQLWLWVFLFGLAATAVIAGWRGAGGWRRNASVFATSFCLLCAGLTINGWLGYFPTVDAAWSQLTNRPLHNQVDIKAAYAMQRKSVAVHGGKLVAVTTGSRVSGFPHRREWVYLPPAWFSGKPLPAILMIGGEFGTPADWIRVGNATRALDAYAAAHGGDAPIAVFADATGGFAVDTECVDGPRGNAAQHLVAEVIPEIGDMFGLGGQPKWGVVGFSSGGTCAVDLAVMHPEIFRAFVDIGGDIGPNAGTQEQTIDRLFGGDAEAYWRFDPRTAIRRHGPYTGLSGLFAVPGTSGDRDGVGQDAAEALCESARDSGISCELTALPGKHDWPSAAGAFAVTLPWLTERLGMTGDAGSVAE
nr:alpha/beta hydrolase-fold protein [Mycobacterium gordonae]